MTLPDRHLEDARARLVAAEYGPALDALLEAWRAFRASEIAELCEMLSSRAARHHSLSDLAPHNPAIRMESVVAWTHAFRSRTVLRLGVLIADMDAAFAEKTPARFLYPRVEAIANEVEDDPRITKLIIRVATQIEEGGAWRKFVPQCVLAFQKTRDPRFVSLLAHAITENDTAPAFVSGSLLAPRSKALYAIRKAMADGPPPLPEELVAITNAIRSSIDAIPPDVVIALPAAKTESADPATLFADVYDNPHDDDLRLVLADALMSTADPRGEFILLQCRRARGEHAEDEDRAKSLSRERGLFEEHRRAWLGPLASVVTIGSAVFERGFLDRCEAIVSKRVDAEVHFGHAEWATVRSIAFRGESRITPVMKSLCEAIAVDSSGLTQLTSSGGHPRLERLGLTRLAVWMPPGSPDINESVQALVKCEGLPALRHLDLPFAGTNQASWIWKAAWSKQLRSVGVLAESASVGAWITELRRRNGLEEVSFYSPMHRTTVRAEEKGLRLIVHLEASELPPYIERALQDVLRELLATRERFTHKEATSPAAIRLTAIQRARLEKTLARFK